MSAFEEIFRGYAQQMRGFLRADRLYQELIKHAHDGTESYCAVDSALRGVENQRAAAAIKRALLAQYRDTIPVSVAVEIMLKLGEDEAERSKEIPA